MEKIAIIDLGSNTARLVLVNVVEGGYFMVFDELKESVRLGQDMERDGFLKSGRVSDTIKTIKNFKKLCDANHIERIIAVATAAVRRAKNQKNFLDELSTATGIKFRVLSEEEEAMGVYHGVINSMEIPKGVIMEIGGGSTKIVYYNRRNLLKFATLPFGAITLTDMFMHDDIQPAEQARKIEIFMREQFERLGWLKEVEPDVQFIGVGGSFRNLGKISRRITKYPVDISHNYNMSANNFNDIYDIFKVLDLDKKTKIKGLSSGRADIFPSALSAIKAFMDYMEFNDITISGCGLREGLLFNYTVPSTLEKPISDVLGYSIDMLVRQFGVDKAHVDQVYFLSMQLFKQLRVLHKFPRFYTRVLRVASMLHSCGVNVKFYNYEKHSSFIILNSLIYGISHRELVLASLILAALKRDDFLDSDIAKYRELLTDEDVEVIRRLAVILRIAIALDRGLGGVIKSLNCDVLGDSVIMKTELGGDATLEIKEALRAGSDFRRAFKKNLDIL